MRKRLQFETREVKLSDIKFTEGVFISDRKVQRFAAQFKGTLPVSTESHEEWTENVRFLASLIAALTSRARFDAHHQDATLKTAVAPKGVVEPHSTSLRNREFPQSVFGSATLAPRRAVAQRFPNLVEGNGVRGRQDLALLDGLMQWTLLKLLLSPRGLCERRGDL
jgi:hypothetical protein